MKNAYTFVQGFNAQAAVASSGRVVAGDVVNEANDQAQLVPMIEQTKEALGASLKRVAVDGGYWSPDQIEQVPDEVEVFVPKDLPGRPPEGANDNENDDPSLREQFIAKAETAKGQAMQAFRRGVVEPVFGDARENKGVVRFLRRGLDGVAVEWALVLVGVNLRRMVSMVDG